MMHIGPALYRTPKALLVLVLCIGCTIEIEPPELVGQGAIDAASPSGDTLARRDVGRSTDMNVLTTDIGFMADMDVQMMSMDAEFVPPDAAGNADAGRGEAETGWQTKSDRPWLMHTLSSDCNLPTSAINCPRDMKPAFSM